MLGRWLHVKEDGSRPKYLSNPGPSLTILDKTDRALSLLPENPVELRDVDQTVP